MGLFKKKKIKNKKIYKIVWKFSSSSTDSFTELVKADDLADAWALVKMEHSLPISLISCEEIYNSYIKKDANS